MEYQDPAIEQELPEEEYQPRQVQDRQVLLIRHADSSSKVAVTIIGSEYPELTVEVISGRDPYDSLIHWLWEWEPTVRERVLLSARYAQENQLVGKVGVKVKHRSSGAKEIFVYSLVPGIEGAVKLEAHLHVSMYGKLNERVQFPLVFLPIFARQVQTSDEFEWTHMHPYAGLDPEDFAPLSEYLPEGGS